MPRWVWHAEFFRFDIRRKFLQARFQPGAFFLKLNFFGGKFFQPNDVALLLQIERVDFVAHARELLRGGKSIRLRFAQGFLLSRTSRVRPAATPPVWLQALVRCCQRAWPMARGKFLGDRSRVPASAATPFFGLRDVRERFGVLRIQIPASVLR